MSQGFNLVGKDKAQQGSVLLIALIVMAAVSILSASILYVIKVSLVQNQAINRYNDARSAAFLALKKEIATSQVQYSNLPSQATCYYSSGDTNVEVSRTANGITAESLALNNPAGDLQYQFSITTTDQKGVHLNYHALLNLPSLYRLNDSVVPAITQEINIPIIKTEALSADQLNDSGSIDTGQAGYIGEISLDNTVKVLRLTPDLLNASASFTLAYPDDGNNYDLTQGWRLQDGKWYWYVLIYDPDGNYAYQTDISLSNLQNSPNFFSSLTWTQILSPLDTGPDTYSAALQYPKGTYVIYDGQLFVSLNPVNSGQGKDPYSLPNDWRLVIAANSYPAWNTNVKYFKGDVITYNGVKYVAIRDNNANQSAPPSNRWAEVSSDVASSWQAQVYRPGDLVTYNGFTFINVRRSSQSKTPDQQSGRWRIVKLSEASLIYNASVYYTPGITVSYNGQIFVNKKDPYQRSANWRLVIPEGSAPQYNANVRYYMGDRVTFQGLVYEVNQNYNQFVRPGQTPATNPNKWTLV